jgi:hypothetical protein
MTRHVTQMTANLSLILLNKRQSNSSKQRVRLFITLCRKSFVEVATFLHPFAFYCAFVQSLHYTYYSVI